MTTAPPTVSVVICAYTQRRWADLQAAVESVRAVAETTEVILVIDHEATLLEMARHRWPDLLVVSNEGAQGLSDARNTGTRLASCEIVAFLDDDARADADWLGWLLDAFTDPAVAGVGGHAEPLWPDATRPTLYPDELLWIVGCSYRGLPTGFAYVRNIMGCSMAFRRSQLVAVGGFSTAVGRVGTVPLGDEETELCIRIRQMDPLARICYEPLSLVMHRVGPDRTTWRYLSRRSFYEGASKALITRRLGRRDALATESTYLAKVLPHALGRELREIGSGGLTRCLAIVTSVALTVTGYVVGTIASALTKSRARPEPHSAAAGAR